MADSDSRFVRSLRNGAMRILLAGAALGTILVVSVAPAAPSAAKPLTLTTRGQVSALAADGERAAFMVRGRVPNCDSFCRCWSVFVWEPIRRRVVQLRRCGGDEDSFEHDFTQTVAIAGTRVAWVRFYPNPETDTLVMTATLARPSPVAVAHAIYHADGHYGDLARRPAGDGTLLAFTVDRTCSAERGGDPPCPPGRKDGDIVAATVWRAAGRDDCPTHFSRVPRCSRVAQADGKLNVLAVDAERIAVRTDSGLRLLTVGGDVLRDFDLAARQAALSGSRLAVRTAGAVEVYDIDSGKLTARLAAAPSVRLEDLDRDILVTAKGRTVTLRRLSNGRASTIRGGEFAHAQLEHPGLFVAAGRRVTFTPMREVLRRLGD
jgi:hypothetical protein